MECISLQNAEYLSEYKIRLTFNTGEEGIVDLEELIFSSPTAEILQDEDEFANFYLDEGSMLTWECGFEVEPELLYELEIIEEEELAGQGGDKDYSAGKSQSSHKFSYDHIEGAYNFVSSAEYGINGALICRDTGRILRRSDISGEDEIAEAEENGTINWHETVELPHRNDLGQESKSEKEALLQWCKENSIQLED